MRHSVWVLKLALVLLCTGAGTAVAEMRLAVWQAAPESARILVPQRADESPREAVERYLRSVQAEPELQSLHPERGVRYEIFQSRSFESYLRSPKPLVALLANTFEDMHPKGERMSRNLRAFTSAGGDVFTVALAADIGLSETEAKEFRELIARRVDLLVALGGADISPELYGEKITHAVNVNFRRDWSEYKLIERFKTEARGVFFGICRGHQLGAVIDGHTLNQDLTRDGVGLTHEHVNSEGTNAHSRQRWHHIFVSHSLLYRFLKKQFLIVNSIHHQSVRVQPGAASQPVAFFEGIVEGLQMKNGLGLSVQSHPELPADVSGDAEFSKNGARILQGVVSYARLIRKKHGSPPLCGHIFP